MLPNRDEDAAAAGADATTAAADTTTTAAADATTAAEGAPAPTASTDNAATPAPAAKKPARRRKPKHTEYYALLEVDVNADEDELKRAYRKQALKYHPDKRTGDPEKFIQMKRAYDVLRNPETRALYDQRGAAYVAAVEENNWMERARMDIVESRTARLTLISCVAVPVAYLVSTPILVSVKWDGAPWSWALTLVPVWVAQGVAFFVWFCFKGFGPEEGDEEEEEEEGANPEGGAAARKRRPFRERVASDPGILVNTLLFSLAIIFEAFFVSRLDGTVTWSWFGVFAPAYAGEAVLVAYRFWDANAQMRDMRDVLGALLARLQAEYEDSAAAAAEEGQAEQLASLKHELERVSAERDTLRVSRMYLLQASFWPTVRAATELAIAAKADNLFSGTWFFTAIPLMVGVFLWSVAESLERRDEGVIVVLASIAVTIVAGPSLLWLLVWLLGMAKLDNASVFSAFAVFGPVYVILGLLLVFATTLLLCFPSALFEAQKAATGKSGSGGTPAPAPAPAPASAPATGEAAAAGGAAANGAEGATAARVVQVTVDEVVVRDRNGDASVTVAAATASTISLGYVPPEQRTGAGAGAGAGAKLETADAAGDAAGSASTPGAAAAAAAPEAPEAPAAAGSGPAAPAADHEVTDAEAQQPAGAATSEALTMT